MELLSEEQHREKKWHFINNDLQLIRESLSADEEAWLARLYELTASMETDEMGNEIHKYEQELLIAVLENRVIIHLGPSDLVHMVKFSYKYNRHYFEGVDKKHGLFHSKFWLGCTLNSIHQIKVRLDPLEKQWHHLLWELHERFQCLMVEAAKLKCLMKATNDSAALRPRKLKLAEEVAISTNEYIELIKKLAEKWEKRMVYGSLTPLLLSIILEKQQHLIEHIRMEGLEKAGALVRSAIAERTQSPRRTLVGAESSSSPVGGSRRIPIAKTDLGTNLEAQLPSPFGSPSTAPATLVGTMSPRYRPLG